MYKNAYVNPVPRGSKTASQPKTLGPLAGTIVPSVLPSNKIGSVPEYFFISSVYFLFNMVLYIPGPAE